MSKATQTSSRVFKEVSPFEKVEVLPVYHQNHKDTLKSTNILN
ncbi:hypothetical protein E2C01_102853 [Portunus trituberculatus]|uniref:Uncharacterized protein n=1 Tax=Portunus trituberculatus TaxID=210409 RepID=A0A5B7K9A7_PORTR|nr:hypothetical protein [Portunus trituberculatus]